MHCAIPVGEYGPPANTSFPPGSMPQTAPDRFSSFCMAQSWPMDKHTDNQATCQFVLSCPFTVFIHTIFFTSSSTGNHQALTQQLSNAPGAVLQRLCHDNSTINSIIVCCHHCYKNNWKKTNSIAVKTNFLLQQPAPAIHHPAFNVPCVGTHGS